MATTYELPAPNSGATVVQDYLAVANTTARDAIPASSRVEGMIVYSVADDVEFRLLSDLTSWLPLCQTIKRSFAAESEAGITLPFAIEDFTFYVVCRSINIADFVEYRTTITSTSTFTIFANQIITGDVAMAVYPIAS